eukprot:m.162010 g.162010  ORF g.162010 m.162010 type:complete len:55 (-) comp13404_c0_seq8:1585-1749(-)
MKPYSTGNDLDVMALVGLQHGLCTTATLSQTTPVRQATVRIEGINGSWFDIFIT